ncbi:MAG: YihY/virulence factor BrkB family protein [Chloroflexi bacterium]|nr:YihY/virulence factor BrkB family protein [Chloroflexota bacterium]
MTGSTARQRGQAMVEDSAYAEQAIERNLASAAGRAPTPAKLVWGSLKDFGAHADGVHAGAMAFFGVLSLFPLVLLLIVIFSVVLPSSQARQLVIGQLSALLPDASPVAGATNATIHVQSAAVGVSIFTLLWGSVGVFMTVGYAFDRAWGIKRDRNIVVQYLVAAALTLAVGAAISVASVLTRAASPAGGVAVLALEALAVCAGLIVLYRALPNADVKWGECFAPAVAVTLVCGLARGAFTWYLSSIAHVDRTYGPAASIAGLMLWLFITSAVVVWGVELSHQLAGTCVVDEKR